MTQKKKTIDLDGKIIDKIIKEIAKDMGLESELLRDKETYESLQNIVSLCIGLYMAELMPNEEAFDVPELNDKDGGEDDGSGGVLQ